MAKPPDPVVGSDRPEFGTYAAERSPRLLRTAFLLCRDWGTAEDLVQTALTKAWLAWPRVGDDPDPYVYRILVNTHHSWWRRRWRGEVPTGDLPELPLPEGRGVEDRDVLWKALGGLGRASAPRSCSGISATWNMPRSPGSSAAHRSRSAARSAGRWPSSASTRRSATVSRPRPSSRTRGSDHALHRKGPAGHA